MLMWGPKGGEKEVAMPAAEPIRGTFTLEGKNKSMHVAIPGGIEQEYTTAGAPPLLDVEEGYDKKSARVMSIRLTGDGGSISAAATS